MSVFLGVTATLLAATQPVDPLAPAPTPEQQEPSDATPAELPPPPPATPIITVPRDWRGVFDAIRTGQWAAAQAGIATLPPSPLASVAKAELYTA